MSHESTDGRAPIATCALVVHGAGLEDHPGSTIAASITVTPRRDGRALVQVTPLETRHRRRYRTLAFIVSRPELNTLEARNGK
jgi:hypothetical protein